MSTFYLMIEFTVGRSTPEVLKAPFAAHSRHKKPLSCLLDGDVLICLRQVEEGTPSPRPTRPCDFLLMVPRQFSARAAICLQTSN